MTASDHPATNRSNYAAVALNYRHWADTIACVQSLLDSHTPPRHVVVCDNGSNDQSIERLGQWADEKAIPWRLLRLEEARHATAENAFPQEKLLIVDIGSNLGYAGGNNVGLRLLLASDIPFIWIVNNDVVVAPDAADALCEHMARHPGCGLCGALTRYLETPDIVQCYGGGWYDPIWGKGGLHGEGQVLPRGAVPENGPDSLDYVNGASVFARREFLEQVGLMEESYFLYCEELDWAERAKGRWDLGWTAQAEVLHREGVSTGLSNRRGLRFSPKALLRLARSRLLFTLRFHPWALPTVLLGQFLAALRRVVR